MKKQLIHCHSGAGRNLVEKHECLKQSIKFMPISPLENISSAEAPELRPKTPEYRGESGEIKASPEASPIEKGRAELARPDLVISGMQPSPAPSAATADEAFLKYQAIEKVLEEDLADIYSGLSPAEQKLFKMKGEEAAKNIFRMVYHESKIKVKKIIKAIRDWLKAVPGMNKFFLEQEAKLKADKIVKLAEAAKKIEY